MMQPNAATRAVIMKPDLQSCAPVFGSGLRGLAFMLLLLALPVGLTALGAATGLLRLPYELALAAVPVAMASEASGPARAGFLLQAIVWILLVWAAVAVIRGGNRTQHIWLMLAVTAVASGALWLRLAGWAAIKLNLPFETVYALAAWLSWMLPLCIIYLIARYRMGEAVHHATGG